MTKKVQEAVASLPEAMLEQGRRFEQKVYESTMMFGTKAEANYEASLTWAKYVRECLQIRRKPTSKVGALSRYNNHNYRPFMGV